MSSNIYIIMQFIDIHRLYIFKRYLFWQVGILQIVFVCFWSAVVKIQATSISADPQILCIILHYTADYIITDGIGEWNMLNMLKTIAQRMIIVQSSPISAQPHSSLRIHKNTTYRILWQTPLLYCRISHRQKAIFTSFVNIQAPISANPQSVFLIYGQRTHIVWIQTGISVLMSIILQLLGFSIIHV